MAVHSKRGYLYLEFQCFAPDGSKLRCREATRLKDNKKNRKIVNDKNKAIRYALKIGRFDYLRFFPTGAKAHLFKNSAKDILFKDWWELWLSEKTLRYNTQTGWDATYRNHIGPHFGHMMLSQINEHEILVFRKVLENKGLKASTINSKMMKLLCMALYHAHRRGKISSYPCQEIKKLEEESPDIDPFTFEEIEHLLGKLKEYRRMVYHDMILFWVATGLRVGELCALRWEHVDFFNQKIMIRQSMLPTGSVGPPKTKHSVRDVDITDLALEALKRQEERTGALNGYVWLTSAGKPFTSAFLRKKFRFIMRLARLKYRPPKQLRHTFATLHIGVGENISWVSRMLGHASIEITAKRYNRFVKNLTHQDGSLFSAKFPRKTQFNFRHPVAEPNQKETE
jgi:integrase